MPETVKQTDKRTTQNGHGERKQQPRLHLSPPHLSGREQHYVQEAFDSNWIAPLGPHVDAFEKEFACALANAVPGARDGHVPHTLALNSGTSALHLALQLLGVQAGDEVLVSTLTFAASVNPICYLNAIPTFVDSETTSWNVDPDLLAETIEQRARAGRLPAAVVVVHLYGQSADTHPILDVCRRYDIPLIEDAAEALGATYHDKAPGTLGDAGIFSFNGNKIITTSGGGMLVSPHKELIDHARKLATQARDDAPHYEHSEIGYNYRLSNVLAAIGRGQLELLEQRVQARRRNFTRYQQALQDLPGIRFMPEAPWGRSSRWLTVLTIDPGPFGTDREAVRQALEAHNIESRPVWKPMHLQPIFRDYPCVGGHVAESLFTHGLCLPSGSALTHDDIQRVAGIIHDVHHIQ